MTDRIPAEVFPPGEFIRDELEARDWTQQDLADILGRPIQAVNEVISAKKSITPETAQGLGDAFGTGAQLWLNLESVYRLSLCRLHSDKDVARRARVYDKAPIKQMTKRGWIGESSNTEDLEREIVRFFELESIESSPILSAAARKSTSYGERTPSELAWCFRAKHLASTLDAAAYSEDGLLERLSSLRQLAGDIEGIERVPDFLANLGIRLVIVEHLPKTHMDGVAFWLDEQSPVIAMSLRYDRIDWFWHTLGHELWHIKNRDSWELDNNLVGKGRQKTADKPDSERKADEMAARLMVSGKEIDSFIARVRPLFSKKRIVQFANRIGVHPGIVVGQLQHRGEIGYSHSREMLEKVRGLITQTTLTDGWGYSSAR